MENYVITTLLVYTVLREIVFMVQMNKLMNKLMSRNYHEYQVAEVATKPREKVKTAGAT